MKIKYRPELTIRQSILIATLTIVSVVMMVSSIVYFFVFSSRVGALVESQSREINKQIVLNYESYIESIIETADFIQSSSLSLDLAADYQKLQNLYLLNSQVKSDVIGLFLFDTRGRKVLGDRISPVHVRNIPDESWYLSAISDGSIFHFHSSGGRSVSQDRDEEVISVSKQVSYLDGGIRRKGVLLIELNFQLIRNLAGKTNLGVGGHTLIIDENDSLIYSSENPDTFTGESLTLASAQILGGRKVTIDSHELFLFINTLSSTRWRIATFINVDEIISFRRSVLIILLAIFLTSFVATAIVAGMISKRISGPVSQLQHIMARIEGGAIDTEVNITGQTEIVMLGRSFNSMIEKIRVLMDTVVNEQQEKRKTELQVLQNQINPHFLYNSLDSIVWLAENGRSDDVITTVIALARFFRISISRGETFIPVETEIEHVKNYLTIQSIRYVDKFTYEISVDESILKKPVMKLILQPLVENAIHHGIGEEHGSISIRGWQEPEAIFFQVTNTGYGLSESRIREIHNNLDGFSSGTTGIGLRNVSQRLKLYYGVKAGIRVSSRPDEETTATIRIPHSREDVV